MTDKFAFIDAEKAMFPIVKMYVWLDVSTSGYDEWRDRPASATAQRRQRLTALIQAIFGESDSTYGYRRVHAALARQGDDCGPELVREITCERGPWSRASHARGGRQPRSPVTGPQRSRPGGTRLQRGRARAGNWSETSPICRHGRVSPTWPRSSTPSGRARSDVGLEEVGPSLNPTQVSHVILVRCRLIAWMIRISHSLSLMCSARRSL